MSIPGAASPLFLATTAGAADAFSVSKSLRFNSGDSANLSRTFGSAGNRKTWTWSGWVKRSQIGGQKHGLFGGSGTNSMIRFNNDDGGDNLRVLDAATGGYDVITDRKFRDTSAWYHFVVAIDTTESTAANRVKIYVNGVQETSFFSSSYPTQNADLTFNNNISHTIGYAPGSTYHDGYLAEVNFVDGQALAPTDFGETDANGVWQAKEFTGTYGWFNNSQTWSTYGSHSGSTSNTTGSGWQSAFDISPTTYTWSAGGSDLTFTSGIPYTSKVEIYGYKFSSSNQIRVNGSAVSGFNIGTSDTNLGWVTALTGSGNLTSIGSTGYGLVARVRVDGKLLIDSGISVADNSFRLPFTDNSTTQALGYDQKETVTLNPKGGMDVVTYSGNGGTQSISSLAFQPDFVWIKSRTSTNGHNLYDSVRGANKYLSSHLTAAEGTATNELMSFDSDGFSLGNAAGVNGSSKDYVAWCWKANGAAVSNTDGSLNSQVSANNDYGFSIVSYTGGRSSAGNNTVGHGLSSAPKLVITKSRASNSDWVIQSPLLSANKVLFFKDWAEYDISSGGSLSDPTSSVFSTNYFTGLDTSGDSLIAYCWSEVAGFSKFGSYTGNGSATGPTITTGFKPTYVLIKRTDSSGYHWAIIDAKRGTNKELLANLSAAEGSTLSVSFTSTGFQITNTAPDINGSGGTFIYAAFADRPGNNWTPNNLLASGLFANAGFTNPGNAFDGNTGTYAEVNTSAALGQFVFPDGIAVSSSVKIKYSSATSGNVYLNGSATALAGTGAQEHNISFSGTLNTIGIQSSSQPVIYYIDIDNNGAYLTGSDVVDQDSLVDSPSNGTQDDTGVGGEVVGCYATLNSLYTTSSGAVLSDGNLKFVTAGSNGNSAMSATIAVSSGKWYWEITPTNIGSGVAIGIAYASEQTTDYPGYPATSWSYRSNSTKMNNASSSSYGVSYTTGDVIGVALDLDNGTLAFYKNGASQGTAFTSLSGEFVPKIGDLGSSSTMIANFGQRAFAYAAPSGYKSLNTANLPTPAIADGSKYFDTKLYSGTGSSQNITGLNFSPDWVWTKARSHTDFHTLIDAVRGPSKTLYSNDTAAEGTDATGITAFNSDGYSLGANTTAGSVNINGRSYVSWNWDGGNGNNTYTVTVSGGKFYIDGVQQPTLTLAEGSTYKFDQADSTNSGHPLRFSTTSDGTHGGGSEYTTGVTTAGTPGSAGAFTQIVIAASAPTLYAYCTNHSGMGFQVNTSDKGGYTIPAGGLNSSVYDQSQTWSGMMTSTGNGIEPANPATSGFNGTLTGLGCRVNGNSTMTWTPTGGYAFTGSAIIYCAGDGMPSGNQFTCVHAGGTLDFSSSVTTGVTQTAVNLTDLGITSPITSITIASGVSNPRFSGIEIDGKLLIDSGVSVTNVPSIASQVMASPESGFSIVEFTNPSSGTWTFGHGLNAAPEFFVMRPKGATSNWQTYHKGLTALSSGRKFIWLNSTNAELGTTNTYWTSDPDSSVCYAGTGMQPGGQQVHIAYCFAPVAGYSAMGSYTGNGSTDGPFVFTGFRPAFLIQKRTDGVGNWRIRDTARGTYNAIEDVLYADTNNSTITEDPYDFLSNGFKIRTSGPHNNASGGTYIYLAFAENPFQANGGLAR